MSVKSLKMFYPNDMIQLNNFDSRLLKINKRENRENNNIYYISYKINKPEHNINNLYFVVNYLCGTIEKIDCSKDRYLVIDKDRLINKENIDLFYNLWDAIINKIKYLRGNDVMFDDNEVIIKDWNKIRFSSDIFIPNDVLINFHSLVIVINYVIEKNDEFIPEIYIDEGYFEKVLYKIMQLGIKNKLLFHPAKLNNILDINLNKISVEDILNDDNLGVYYIKYNNNIFYLVIDDVKGYFEKAEDNNYLTIIFDNEKYEKIFKNMWDKMKKKSLMSVLENIMQLNLKAMIF